jgi:pimeloyl-ACP methyl ester carboxylesterase
MKNRLSPSSLISLLSIVLIFLIMAHGQNKGNYAEVNGLRMYYEVHGSGSPLVLIHGGGSTIETSFGRLIPLLVKTHKVIAVERQAHGRTDDRDAEATFEQDADDVAALLKQLGVKQADFLGFSNGGHVATEIALRHPGLVNKLILASANINREGMASEFWKGMETPKFSDMPQIYAVAFLKVNNDRAALQRMFERDSTRMRKFKGWSDDQIRSIKRPVLILNGDHNDIILEHVVNMHRLFPNSRLAIFPGTHGSYLGEALSPDTKTVVACVAVIEEFLKGYP